eukprot:TRINITY_DN76954_c0_g1_i1.p1 TRINITY_DN76954_c0_g1~~TRINITY_DN76954_c0_g1_i1.p1  ORF type:complete len:214 (+),score=26.27 TRINITY_DN76954_c0_g1_i1:33-674(+)
MLRVIDLLLCGSVLFASRVCYRIRDELGESKRCSSGKYHIKIAAAGLDMDDHYLGFDSGMVIYGLRRTESTASLKIDVRGKEHAAVFDAKTKKTCGTYHDEVAKQDLTFCLTMNDFDCANTTGGSLCELTFKSNADATDNYAYLDRAGTTDAETMMVLVYDLHSDDIKERFFKHDTKHEFLLNYYKAAKFTIFRRTVDGNGETDKFKLECVEK